MAENILNYLSSNLDGEELVKQNIKEKMYREYEEAVFDYVSSDVAFLTDRIKELEDMGKFCLEDGRFYEKETCQQIENVSPEKIAEQLLNILETEDEKDVNLIKNRFSVLLKSVFEDVEFLSMVCALQSLFDRKKEDFKEHDRYEMILSDYKKLPEIIEFLEDRDNVQIEEIEAGLSISREKLYDTISGVDSLFNIRRFEQGELISLAPKGRKVKEHIKRRQKKVYSMEELENFIYMNSHKLIQSFRVPLSDISDDISVIPLSRQRKRKLSFEYRFIRKELERKKQVIDAEDILKFDINETPQDIDIYNMREGKIEYEREWESNGDFSRAFGRYAAIVK